MTCRLKLFKSQPIHRSCISDLLPVFSSICVAAKRELYKPISGERESITRVQTCPVFKTCISSFRPSEGFVKACRSARFLRHAIRVLYIYIYRPPPPPPHTHTHISPILFLRGLKLGVGWGGGGVLSSWKRFYWMRRVYSVDVRINHRFLSAKCVISNAL